MAVADARLLPQTGLLSDDDLAGLKAPTQLSLSDDDFKQLAVPTTRGQADDQQVATQVSGMGLDGTMLGKGIKTLSRYTDPSNIPVIKNVVNYASGIDAGIAKGIGGAIQAVADQLDSKLGTRVRNGTDSLAASLAGPDPAGFGSQMAGEALPYAAIGEALAPLKATGIVAKGAKFLAPAVSAGALNLQQGDTRAQRNKGRAIDAATAVPAAVLFGVAGGAISKIGAKIANNSEIKNLLSDITDEFSNFKPEATQLGTKLAASTKNIVTSLTRRNQTIARSAASKGGPPTDDLVATLQDVKKNYSPPADTKNDASHAFLEKTQTALDGYLPKPLKGDASDFVQKAKLTGAYVKPRGQNMTSADYQKLMADTQTTPGKQGDLLDMRSKAIEIQNFMDKVPPVDRGTASYQRLGQIKDSLTGATDKFLNADGNGALRLVVNDADTRYKAFLARVNDPAVRTFVTSTDPGEKAAAGLAIAKSGNGRQAQYVADMLGKEDSQTIGNIALHDALLKSMNDKGHYDAAKFSAYFKDKDSAASLKPFIGPKNQAAVEGITNLLKDNVANKTLASLGGMAHTAGDLGATGAVIGAATHAVTGGHLLIPHLMGKMVKAAAMHTAGKTIDDLLTNKIGTNFFIAASKLKPNTPEMGQLVHVYARRLGNLGAAATVQSGATQYLNQ